MCVFVCAFSGFKKVGFHKVATESFPVNCSLGATSTEGLDEEEGPCHTRVLHRRDY